MTTEHMPDAVRTTIATLRTVAHWLPDADRAHLLETAHTAEIAWDGGCCPVCQETFCDGGCPLEEVRAEMYKREAVHAKMAAEQAEQCDGRHPLVRPDGTQIYLYDLVTHPDCPHQPWADSKDNAMTLRHTLPPWEPFRMPVPIALDPAYQRPVFPDSCYDASFGRVHVRPGCRC